MLRSLRPLVWSDCSSNHMALRPMARANIERLHCRLEIVEGEVWPAFVGTSCEKLPHLRQLFSFVVKTNKNSPERTQGSRDEEDQTDKTATIWSLEELMSQARRTCWVCFETAFARLRNSPSFILYTSGSTASRKARSPAIRHLFTNETIAAKC